MLANVIDCVRDIRSPAWRQLVTDEFEVCVWRVTVKNNTTESRA